MADAPPALDSSPTAAMPRVRFTLADPTSWRTEPPRRFTSLNLAITGSMATTINVLWLSPLAVAFFSAAWMLDRYNVTMNPLWIPLAFLMVVVALGVGLSYIWLVPLLNGGIFYRDLLAALRPELPPEAADGRPIQITCEPRLKSGLRRWIDDADDVGVLYLERDGFHFVGDHTELRLRIDDVGGVSTRRSDFHSIWISGLRTRIEIEGIDGLQAVILQDVGAATVLGTRRANAALLEAVREHLKTDPSQAALVPDADALQRQRPRSKVPDEYLPPMS